ncbi:hypothetical protein BB558_005837 [Smittium angustum]|uniref:Uncharacterized protein n=1 Tax=Smittium angustum TaxID=133377 RepID=A0A2U1IZB8_SMIAN|nr:hypothetical protein BB558_005957 [Smittium angustum]PVZ98164.1 hypothetical protein BB558_005837 [Smittium angustum]
MFSGILRATRANVFGITGSNTLQGLGMSTSNSIATGLAKQKRLRRNRDDKPPQANKNMRISKI